MPISPLPAPYLPTYGTSAVSGYITPPPSIPKPLAIGGTFVGALSIGLLTLDLVGKAGAYRWRDDLLSKIGNSDVPRGTSPPPPFTGGQSQTLYNVSWRAVIQRSGQADEIQTGVRNTVRGRIRGTFNRSIVPISSTDSRFRGDAGIIGTDTSGNPQETGVIGFAAGGVIRLVFEITSIVRSDGLPDTGGNLPVSPPPSVPAGYTPTTSPFQSEQDRKVATPLPTPPANNPSNNPSNTPNRLANPTPNSFAPASTPSTKPPSTQPNTPPITSPTTKPITPTPKPNREQERKEQEKKGFLPTISPSPDISQQITGLGAIASLIAFNTSPENLKNAAKTGSCEMMQSPDCTQGMENRIKDPIMDNVDATKAQTVANAGAISSVATLLATVWDFLQNKIGKVLNILNNSVIDRTLAVMNLATNIHNAAMLTRDIGETLGSVVDNVIGLTGLRFTNSEGAQVQFTDFLSSNFRAFLVSVLGAENYVSLVLQWQKANTIYHSAMGVLNTTQSMLDPISSAVEYGMENVSKIGNSLKEDGVVSENAYPAMDETIRARRVNRFERLNDTLEGAENIASNLSSVTSSAVSVKEDWKQLREDSKDLKDKASAFNTADSEARAALKAELPTEITPITLAPAPAEDEEP